MDIFSKEIIQYMLTSLKEKVALKNHTHSISNVTNLQTDLNKKQPLTNGLTAETALADADTIPFYDASASVNRKTTWANVKKVLKVYFDTLYNKYTLPTASASVKGGIKVDGKTIVMNGEIASAVSSIDGVMPYTNQVACETVFSSDGKSITQTYADCVKVTTFNDNGTITEKITKGSVVTTKTTKFNDNGSISQTMN